MEGADGIEAYKLLKKLADLCFDKDPETKLYNGPESQLLDPLRRDINKLRLHVGDAKAQSTENDE